MAQAKRDQNSVVTLLAVSNVDGITPVVLWADPTTHRLLVDITGSTPDVTYVTVGNANADFLVGSYIDVGDAINAAYASLPSTGGSIFIQTGAYSFVTPIVLNTLNKPVTLIGASAGGGTTLTYTGGTTTVACTINVTKAVTPGYGIQNLKFVGPNSKGSTVGIQLGGMGADDGKGFAGGTLRDVHVRGFGCNILVGNNVFILTMDNVISNFGGVLLFEKGGAGAGATTWLINGANTINSGERMVAMNCTFADSDNTLFGESSARYAVHLQVSGLTDWDFIGTSFDDCELYIDYSGGTGNQVHLTDCHFENPAGDSLAVYTFITTLSGSASTQLDLTDTTFVQDANASAAPTFISAGCQVTAKGCSLTRNAGAGAATLGSFVSFINADATNNLRFSGIGNFSSAATNMATNGTNTLAMTGGTGVVNGLMVFSYINGGGVLKAQDFNTVYDASQFPGANIGAQVNNAYARGVAAGLSGMIITLPAGTSSYSTAINIGTDGVRASLRGAPGGGTRLQFTGGANTTAITINCGYQGDGAGSEHNKYEAVRDITLVGNATSTTNPQQGITCGGANGAAGAIIRDCLIEGFGQGLVITSNTYAFLCADTVVRNCGQNVYITTPSNSGESIMFENCFIVDGASNTPTDGFVAEISGSVSITVIGGSFDDCQVRIGQASNISFYGTHFENPGASAWGSYTYVVIDTNSSAASNVNMNGCIFWQDGTGGNKPSTFISNGGTLTLDSCYARTLTGQSVATMVTMVSPGVVKWSNIKNVSSAYTNFMTGIADVSSGWCDSNGVYTTIDNTGKITAYRGLATAGIGVQAVRASGRSTAQTAAKASLATFTVGTSDATFVVSGNVNVTTSTAHSFTMTCTYTDETNTSQTLTLNFSQPAGTLLTTITNVTGAGPYEGVPVHIRCKASTAITFATVGTFTTVTYNAEAQATQIA